MTRVDKMFHTPNSLTDKEIGNLNKLRKYPKLLEKTSVSQLKSLLQGLEKEKQGYEKRNSINNITKAFWRMITKVKKVIYKKEHQWHKEVTSNKLSHLEKAFNDLFKSNGTFFDEAINYINKFLIIWKERKEYYSKVSNLYWVYKELKSNSNKLKIFQEYMNKKYSMHLKVDWNWWKNSKDAFEYYLKTYKNIHLSTILNLEKKIEEIKQKRLKKINWKDKPDTTENDAISTSLDVNKINDTYEKYINKHNPKWMSEHYKVSYLKRTLQSEKYELPRWAKEIMKKFNSIDINDVLRNPHLKNLRTKYLIKEHWVAMKTLLMWGLVKALKKSNRYFWWRVDINKLPIIINVPLEKKEGKRFNNASLSFMYNPKTKKLDVDVFSYWFRWEINHIIWSNKDNTHASSLWTQIVYLKKWLYKPGKHIHGSKWNFAFTLNWLDKGVNDHEQRRGIKFHWISPKRSNLIKLWSTTNHTIGSRWCLTYAHRDYPKNLKHSGAPYSILETTYPVI